MKYLSVLVIGVFLIAGCSRRPQDILDEDRMVAIMADIQIAEAYERSGESQDFLNGKDREMLGRGILKHHGVTVEEMDSTLAWYGRNMDEYSKLYKKVDAVLAKRQAFYARAAGESENDESSDLWPYVRHIVVDDKSLSDGFSVDIPVSEVSPGDKIYWKMATRGATGRTLSLGVEYEDGFSEMTKITNRGFDKRVEAMLQTDSSRNVTRIFATAGFEHSAPRVFIDSIQLLQVPFNREEYVKGGYQRKIAPAGRKIVLPPDTSANSNLVPDSIIVRPSLSTEKRRGVKTRL